jgi:predicted O-methyltransferase YrrM
VSEEVDHLIEGLLLDRDPALEAALDSGLPPIDVTPLQGKLLHLLARVQGARRILELGTLGGYSTIWLARALPEGGSLVTVESEPRHAEVARENIARAGLAEIVDLRVGRGLDVLPELEGPFDLVFIDADKAGTADYIEWAVRLGRPGTLVIADNVVRGGRVADPATGDASALGARRGLELLGSHPQLDATAIQTVGAKGHDGFALAIVTERA